MKIVYLHEHLISVGGLERIFIQKMNYLAERLHYDVYLVTTSQGNHPFSFPLSKQVKHFDLDINFHLRYRYPYPKRLWIRLKLDSLFKTRAQEMMDRIDPDFIIGTTAWRPEVICRLKGRAKKIMESHCAKSYISMPDTRTTSFVKDKLNKYATRRRLRAAEKYSDAVITLTRTDAKAWEKARKVYVIPNFTEYMPPQSSTCEIPRAIAVGRLSYQKGFDRLVSIWSIVNKRFPDWKLDIYGEGICKEALKKQIGELHLDKIVTIHPFTKDILQEYLSSSLFVLSSNYEGFALVLLEAMACGLPCVSFDCPNGPADIIQNGETGLLVKNGDLEGFTNAICHLLADQEERKELGRKAKQEIMNYSPEKVMLQWDRLFKELL